VISCPLVQVILGRPSEEDYEPRGEVQIAP